MAQHNILDELSRQLSRLLPQGAAAGEEIRQTLHSGLQKSLSKMDLLTREEFEQQKQALERAEARIEELEAIVERLEQEQSS